jgi:cytochrome c oxidase subunit 2
VTGSPIGIGLTAALAQEAGRTSPLRDFVTEVAQILHALLFLPEQASSIAADIDGLHMFIFTVMTGLAAIVGLLSLYFIVRYRRRGDPGPRPRIVAPAWLELGVAGSLLALFCFWWFLSYEQYLRMNRPPPDSDAIYVTGKQWMWKFDYAGGPSSAGVLYVPLGRPVKLLITSRDVIHSFYVPEFRLKQDAVPGRYTTVWFEATRTGTFELMCAEFCGTGHSRMHAKVEVLEPREFDRWLEGQSVEAAVAQGTPLGGEGEAIVERSLAERGRQAAAEHGCLRCHTTDGQPHIGPTWLGLFGSFETLSGGDTVRVDEAYVTESMMDPEAKVVAGFAPVMPTFQGRIRPAETAAIIEFMKALRDTVGVGEEGKRGP